MTDQEQAPFDSRPWYRRTFTDGEWNAMQEVGLMLNDSEQQEQAPLELVEKDASATATLARLPVINDPAISEAMRETERAFRAPKDGLSLAEGERLLAEALKHVFAPDALEVKRWWSWCALNGEALVTAFKAANEHNERMRAWIQEALKAPKAGWTDQMLPAPIDVIEQLRADLTRVEAEAKKWREEADQIHREDTELERLYEAAQARIAELEAAVDMTPDYLGRTKLTYATEVIGLRKDLATERKRIAELEGSLRGVYETHGRADDGPCWCYDCERARANLPAQTPAAS